MRNSHFHTLMQQSQHSLPFVLTCVSICCFLLIVIAPFGYLRCGVLLFILLLTLYLRPASFSEPPSFQVGKTTIRLTPALLNPVAMSAFVIMDAVKDNSFTVASGAVLFGAMLSTSWFIFLASEGLNPIDLARTYFGWVKPNPDLTCPHFKTHLVQLEKYWKVENRKMIEAVVEARGKIFGENTYHLSDQAYFRASQAVMRKEQQLLSDYVISLERTPPLVLDAPVNEIKFPFVVSCLLSATASALIMQGLFAVPPYFVNDINNTWVYKCLSTSLSLFSFSFVYPYFTNFNPTCPKPCPYESDDLSKFPNPYIPFKNFHEKNSVLDLRKDK